MFLKLDCAVPYVCTLINRLTDNEIRFIIKKSPETFLKRVLSLSCDLLQEIIIQ
jgi:hypothetical protein